MLQPFDVLLVALSGWALAYYITHEKGPFNVLLAIRNRFPLGGLTTCIKCALFWTVVLMYVLMLSPFNPVVYTFAAIGAALMLASYSGISYRNGNNVQS